MRAIRAILARMGQFYVYVADHPRTGEPFYVGKGSGRRIRQHDSVAIAGNHHNPHLGNVIRKYGRVQFVVVRAGLSEAEAFETERALIEHFGRRDKKAGTLCNLTDGGEGCAGRPMSESARSRLSAANRGNKHCLGREWSEKQRLKFSASQKGKTVSAEVRAKISATLTGRPGTPHTPESRAKISAALRGKPKPKWTPEKRAAMLAVHLGAKRSPETRAKIGRAHKGKVITESQRAEISARLKGRTLSPETRARMSAGQLLRRAKMRHIPADLFQWAERQQ